MLLLQAATAKLYPGRNTFEFDQDTLPLALKHLSSIDDVKNKKTSLIVSFRVS